MINKMVTIRPDQEEWLKKINLNLSGFLRDRLDERIEMEKSLVFRKASEVSE